jgi:23S rRNA (adenine2503-C2)-methyltransferase
MQCVYRDWHSRYELPEYTLPKKLVRELNASFEFSPLTVEQSLVSAYDGSVKFLVRLADGNKVEAVLMPEDSRVTLCLSSQVGCQRRCAFCHTGRMGLTRNLTASEIVGQFEVACRWIKDNPHWLPANTEALRITNLVFMGMGEPLDNLDEVVRAIRIFSDPLAINIPVRKIAVSTVGPLEQLKTLVREIPDISLAFSLHGTTQGERNRLVPANRESSFTDILEFLKTHFTGHKNKRAFLLVQYILIKDVNDSTDHARRLVEILKDVPVKINLIPFNDVAPLKFSGPTPESMQAFRDVLHQAGLRSMIRYSKGQDIAGACGQLANCNDAKARA